MTDWKSHLSARVPPLSADPAREAEIVDELAQHLTEAEAEALADGASPAEAAAAARAELPDLQAMARAVVTADRPGQVLPPQPPARPWWSPAGLVQDLRYASRQLRRAPAFSLAVVAILAVALGANSAVFSVVNGVLLQPLPYEAPDSLIRIYQGKTVSAIGNYVTGPILTKVRDHARSFDAVAGLYTYRPTGADLTGVGMPRRIATLEVTSGYFRVLGVRPAHGREFRRSDERENAGVVVLSDRLASEVCGDARHCVGRHVTIDGASAEVVGVMPASMRDPIGEQAEAWTPVVVQEEPFNFYLTVIGRLRAGASVASANAELEVLGATDIPPDDRQMLQPTVVSLRADLVGGSQVLLAVLLAAVSLVLLTACTNIANLVLARGVARERELAIRSALGAGRFRLLRQSMAENLVLAGAGGAVGMAIALLVVPALLSINRAAIPRVDEIVPDWRVFAFGAALTLVTALAFGVPSWWQILRRDPERLLRGSAKGVQQGAQRHSFRSGLVVVQVTLAVALLSSSGVLVRSFVRLATTDLGFAPSHVLTYQVNLPDARYPDGASRAALYRRLFERLESTPGITSAGMISRLPATGRFNSWGFGIVGRAAANPRMSRGQADVRCVDGRYFESLGIGLVRGRLLGNHDRDGSAPAAVVNETMARTFWPKGDALGAGITVDSRTVRTIVGIVRDVRHAHDAAPAPTVYLSHGQLADNRNWSMTQVVRAVPGTADLAAAIRREVGRLDPDLVVHHVAALDAVVERGIAGPRFATLLMSGFGAVALLLAAAGIFCVLSYSVSERTSEIGIRMALGARRTAVAWMVTRGAATWALVGVALGLAAAFAARRVLATLVAGMDLLDPTALAGVAALLFVVAVLASWLPARRAVRVDPVRALRAE